MVGIRRNNMNNLVKLGIAAAIIGTATTSANAQSVVPFDYTDTVNGGTVTISGTPPTGSIATVSGVTSNLSSGLPVAFASGLYTFDYSTLTNYMSVKDWTSTIVLEGTVNVIGNTYLSETNPSFLFLGDVTFTGGTWLNAVRIATTGAGGTQTVVGQLGFSGLPGGRSGVDQVYLSATAVPEPGEWAAIGMLGSGLGGLMLRARRRAK
jgi:hypothetical protein